MAGPLSGGWMAAYGNANDYSGALKWGTGVSPVYAQYGEGPPLGVTGRNPEEIGYNPVPPELLPDFEYGYTPEDLPMTSAQDFMTQDVPIRDQPTEVVRRDAGDFPPPRWLARPNGPSGSWFRSLMQPGLVEYATSPHQYPTETVTEGWDNKLSGEVLASETSAQGQYERQTSMQQVDPPDGRNNQAAVRRGTDDARSNIRTRLTGMKVKPWSEGQRTEDMFPFQQDLILRPFWFRNAGTGPVGWMATNEFEPASPIQRDPPSEPYYGPHESEGNSSSTEYGYTPEDWYG